MTENLKVSQELKDNYDKYYDGRSQWRKLSAVAKADNIIELGRKYPHKTLLDIGSGEGSILERLSQLRFGDSLYSLEISRTAVEAILQRGIRNLTECRIFDGYNIPYENNKFDLAVLSHIVEHLEYPRKLLYEASRVAKYIFIEVPLEDNLRLTKNFSHDKAGHINFYSLKTIRRLVQSCNLEIVAQTVNNPSFRTYKYRLGYKSLIAYLPKELAFRLWPGFAMGVWTYHCALLCRKAE